MEYKQLGRSGLKVSIVGLGCMNFGMMNDEAESAAIVDKAIELGGTDEGPPGPRGEGFYAGYFRDLDGNKLNVFWADMSQMG